MSAPHRLAGKRILIVEDERTLADNLPFEIIAAGGEVVGPVGTVDAALQMIAKTDLDGAILDIKVRGKIVFPVADVLSARCTPFIFLATYGDYDVPARHATVPCLEKPAAPDLICRVFERAMSSARSAYRPALRTGCK